jgi:DNA topoisomerase VI subunit B
MNGSTLQRATFTTSRLLEFTSRKELELQTGQPAALWPLVALKELIDNSLDACEEAGIAPLLTLAIDSAKGTIIVSDNGPGIPASTVISILDFNTRTSSREAYASPTRGAQGNALKTVLAMPFALGDGEDAVTIIEACNVRHTIRLSVDVVQQCPVVTHEQERIRKKAGTSVTVHWPVSATMARRGGSIFTISARLRAAQSARQPDRGPRRQAPAVESARSEMDQMAAEPTDLAALVRPRPFRAPAGRLCQPGRQPDGA